jgi:hypothetical protein
MNQYFKFNWYHNYLDEPELIWVELDKDNYEIRKVEKFKDESLSFASKDSENDYTNTFLSEKKIPSLESINLESEFKGIKITKKEFENIWQKACSRDS